VSPRAAVRRLPPRLAAERLATSSIVAGAAFSTLPIAFGAPARITPSRSRVLLRVAPRGFSTVAIGRLSCTAVSPTGTAFPCPPGLDPARSTGITPALRYYAILRLLLGHQPSSSSFSGLPAHSRAGTQQTSLGETLRFRRDDVAITPSARQVSGIAARSRLTQPRNALRRFTLVRHHHAPMASFRPALTETPQRNQPHWSRPINSGPRPCLLDVGFPLSGLQDRTHTSDLNVRARHTPSPATPARKERSLSLTITTNAR
jgi:hypothetical protein